MKRAKRIVIMGAAGRDFHNFNVCYRNNPRYDVVAFTASQIPNIADRVYPAELAGDLYPRGIPIYDEGELPRLILSYSIDAAIFAYSDVSHVEVMHRASLVNSLGADFVLLGASRTMLEGVKPVVSVCAVRTGCGKSPTSRRITELLRRREKVVAVVRHPMPYGEDLNQQRCQRFRTVEDLDRYHCTIEEREEYESHIRQGHVVFAGVDYAEILRHAEQEADIILWDGGNNDIPFYRTDLHIVLVDPHRPGHEVLYYPGESNLRMADVIIATKVGSARREGIDQVARSVADLNPGASFLEADMELRVDGRKITGKRVLAVEDGPTLTHGEMKYGAARVAALRFGAAEIVDPRPFAVGAIREMFLRYPHLVDVLPAMGYTEEQVRDLEATINSVPCDLVLVGTPFDLSGLIHCSHPTARVTYELHEEATRNLERILDRFLAGTATSREEHAKTGFAFHS